VIADDGYSMRGGDRDINNECVRGLANSVSTTQASKTAAGDDSSSTTRTTSTTKSRRLRIRSLAKQDIEQVAQILAEAAVEGDANIKSSWFRSLAQAKAQHMFHNQLTRRFSVLEEARKQRKEHNLLLIQEQQQQSEAQTAPSLLFQQQQSSVVPVLWQSDRFRDKLKKAATETNDKTPWQSHDFTILQPSEASLLHHAMIVAEDCSSQQIAGFVEVAMLPHPAAAAVQSGRCSPTIGNLVSKSTHRRQGVAKRLLSTAMRHVTVHWTEHELDLDQCDIDAEVELEEVGRQPRTIGLYVKQDNHSANTLYSKTGFVPLNVVQCMVENSTEKDIMITSSLTYLERSLCPTDSIA
jgi:ribosomal protein S18 acetylase RimI-like enzyme